MFKFTFIVLIAMIILSALVIVSTYYMPHPSYYQDKAIALCHTDSKPKTVVVDGYVFHCENIP